MIEVVIAVILVIASLAVYALFAALPVMLLWNWLVPYLFALPEINFWQALGLSVLCSILFKSTTSSSKSK